MRVVATGVSISDLTYLEKEKAIDWEIHDGHNNNKINNYID